MAKSTSVMSTMAALQLFFVAVYRLPEEVVSDNVLQFTSEDFMKFLKANGVKHS